MAYTDPTQEKLKQTGNLTGGDSNMSPDVSGPRVPKSPELPTGKMTQNAINRVNTKQQPLASAGGGGFGLNMSGGGGGYPMSKGGGGGPVVKPLSLEESMSNADTRMSTNYKMPVGPAPTDAAFVGGRIPTQYTTQDITQGAIDRVNNPLPQGGGGFGVEQDGVTKATKSISFSNGFKDQFPDKYTENGMFKEPGIITLEDGVLYDTNRPNPNLLKSLQTKDTQDLVGSGGLTPKKQDSTQVTGGMSLERQAIINNDPQDLNDGGFNADTTYQNILDSVGEPLKGFKNIPLKKLDAAGIRAISDAIKTPEQAAAFRKLAEAQVFADGAFAELNKSGTYQMPDNRIMIEEGIKNDKEVANKQKDLIAAAHAKTFGGVGKTGKTGKDWGDTDKVIANAEKRYERYLADKKARVDDPDKKRLIEEITAGIGSEKKSFDPARSRDDIYENTPGDYSGRTDLGTVSTAYQDGPATGTVSTAYQDGPATGTIAPMDQRIGLGSTPSGVNIVRQGNSYRQSNLPTDQQRYMPKDNGKGMFVQNASHQRPEAYPQYQPQQVDPRDLYDMLPETSRDQDFMSYFRTLGDRKKMMKLIKEAGDQNAANQTYALGLNKLNSENIQKDLDRRTQILMQKYGLDRASAEAEVQRSFTADQAQIRRDFTAEQSRMTRDAAKTESDTNRTWLGAEKEKDRTNASENAKVIAGKPRYVQTQSGQWVNANDQKQMDAINQELASIDQTLATGINPKTGIPLNEGQKIALLRRKQGLGPKGGESLEDTLSNYYISQ